MPVTACSLPDDVGAYIERSSFKRSFFKKFHRAWLLTLLAAFALPVHAADVPINLSSGDIAVNTAANTYTVSGGAATPYAAGDRLVISQSTIGLTTHTVVVDGGGTVDVVLSGVRIDVGSEDLIPISIIGNTTVNMALTGASELTSGSYAALNVPKGSTLNLADTDAHDGNLTIYADWGGAGIGGNEGEDGGNITIGGDVKLNVTAGIAGPAGIGGGRDASGSNITIGGRAQVTIEGGGSASAIGGGWTGAAGNITIKDDATVIAYGGSPGGAGIGGGREGAGGNITITGNATVTTLGGAFGPAIGSGSSGMDPAPLMAGTIFIDTTGTLIALGNADEGYEFGLAAAIGQGDYDVDYYGDAPGKGGAGINEFKHPANVSVNPGDNVTFTFGVKLAKSPGITYQWQVSTDGGATWTKLAAETETLSLDNVTATMDGNLYRSAILITGGDLDSGSSITFVSHPAKLTINGASGIAGIAIKTQPRLNYTDGDALDLSGLVVTLTYDDGSSADFVFGVDDFAAAGITLNYANGQTLSAADHGQPITAEANGHTAATDPLTVSGSGPGPGQPAQPIPALGPAMLLMLGMFTPLLGGIALRGTKNGRRKR